MKRNILLSIPVVMMLTAATQSPQQAYIDKYADAAVSEMLRSGVPASITLAQGLLESGSGLSEMAKEGNNHFGIKCHSTWKGKTMYYDDDAKHECFRKYDSVADSYADHSDFLRYQDRYKFLFDYELTDYESWAYGLKSAGYATDPSYATKLIKIIEDYKLYEYDRFEQIKAGSGKVVLYPKLSTDDDETAPGESTSKKKKTITVKDPIPESPLQMEEAQVYTAPKNRLTFKITRPVFTKNGVPFVYSIEGETYESLADAYDLFPKEILKFNDLTVSVPLAPGTVVYLQKKKSSTKRGLNMHIVEQTGEMVYDIAQRYGVTVKSIVKRNKLSSAYATLYSGDCILLR